MKLKTRLTIAFIINIITPIVLGVIVTLLIGQYQLSSIDKTYGLTNASYENLANPMEVYSSLTTGVYNEIETVTENQPELLLRTEYLDEMNRVLQKKQSYLAVRIGNELIYVGDKEKYAKLEKIGLPNYGIDQYKSETGMYIGSEEPALVKQLDYVLDGDVNCSAFIITDVSHGIPELEEYVISILLAFVLILIVTAMSFMFWIQKGIVKPIEKMRVATQNIKHGKLDFELTWDVKDEIGDLCKDFEEMRKRLQANEEEIVAYDQASKELISNITHDLKTPITAIKGYAEGILDGVADTREKQEKYIRTISNKANELNTLINELTVYSKFDRSRIPYNFQTLGVKAYFDDCAEDLLIELEARGIGFEYKNQVSKDKQITADPQQLCRVIHNVISNSVKYMDKKEQRIQLRVEETGNNILVEIEDNGKGIRNEDIPYIFDRFYRTDASRNSMTGGSGIGLSIVRKIMEEHNGKIWAKSVDGVGTTMCFIIRICQEDTNE